VYSWDAENRLVRVMSWGSVDRRRVDWTYDAMGRRVRQVRYVWTNSTWQVVEDLKLVSDPVWFGRHIAELNGTNGAVVRSYVWGLDVSESLDGAGGVGGLLWVRVSGGPAAGVHFVTYDGNGNVWTLVSAGTGTETARYEYGPFGEPLRLTGAAAGSNPFRFSTKRTEDRTGLVLYEYRAYSPTSGRWLTRDPAEEVGFRAQSAPRGRFLRLFVTSTHYVRKQSIDGVDVLGLYEYEWKSPFTDAEKQAMQNSIQRVRQRAETLIGQMNANIESLSKLCPCPAYSQLIENLKRLRKILEGMIRDINDPRKNLEIYRGDIKPDAARYWRSPVPWYDDELTLDNGWFGQSTSEQDSTMFHELSHGQGTGDKDPSPYNNAHAIEVLMHVDKENWTYFKYDKMVADKRCGARGK
jgi:RHS repeat-associated protein